MYTNCATNPAQKEIDANKTIRKIRVNDISTNFVSKGSCNSNEINKTFMNSVIGIVINPQIE
jgi:hypothetical protein